MGRLIGRLIVVVLLVGLVLLKPVFADDVSQVLALYGYHKPVDIKKEQTTLNKLLNEYYTLSKRVSNIEMSQLAVMINEEQYPSLLALRENEVMEKETVLDEIEDLILKNCEGPVEDLLSLESEYLKAEMSLENAKVQLEQLKEGTVKIYKEDTNVKQLKDELNIKDNRVKAQIAKVKKAASFPVIGNCQIKKYPLDAYSYITSDFGKRTDPINTEETQFHTGIDLHASMDTKVTCAYNGIVEKAGFDKALGYFVLIDHGKGLKTIYGHLNSYIVDIGDSVTQYEHIAYSGNSGSRSTGPHLHFGVFIYGEPVDPKVIIPKSL